jgi:hypothetical protein
MEIERPVSRSYRFNTEKGPAQLATVLDLIAGPDVVAKRKIPARYRTPFIDVVFLPVIQTGSFLHICQVPSVLEFLPFHSMLYESVSSFRTGHL